MDPQPPDGWLERMARRAEARPTFMAAALAAYCAEEGIDRAELAERLGGDAAALTRLALCRRPASGSARFQAGVRRIAEHSGVDPDALVRLLRSVETAEAFARPRLISERRPGYDRDPSGLLAAARDREDDAPDDAATEGDDTRPS